MSFPPTYVVIEHDARRHEQFSKLLHLDAASLVLRKIDARLTQQVDAVLRIQVICKPKLPVVTNQME